MNHMTSWIPCLCSPDNKESLRLADGLLRTPSGAAFPIHDGIPSFVGSAGIRDDDARWNRFYNLFSPFYDLNERFWSRVLFGMDLRQEQAAIIASLPIPAGATLLEVSPGPGPWQGPLARALGPEGRIAALDLSMGMLRQCRGRTRKQVPAPFLVHGNASSLPFAETTFDTLFHFGGLNLFTDPDAALREFVRVVKPGATFFVGDEGFGPGIDRNHPKNRSLARANPGFLKVPPTLPKGVRLLEARRIYQDYAYLWILRAEG